MKRKLLSLLALVSMTLTASAISGYQLSTGTSEHGQLKFMVNNAEVTTAQEGVVVTVVVTPDDNWSTKTVTAQAYAEWGDAQAPQHRAGVTILDDLTVSSTDNVNEWTFTMPATKVQVNAEYRKMLTHPTISIEDIASVTYTGSAKKPNVTVKDGDYTLVEGKDYTVTYSNNTNAGTATATVTGKGNYTGSVSKNFTINKASRDVTFNPYHFTRTFGDPDFTIVPTTSGGGILSYSSNDISIATVNSSTGKVHIVGVGKVRITARLSGSSNYRPASDWYEVTVVAKEVAATMIGEIAEQTYTGSPLTPAVVVTDGDATLTEETDYTVEYTNNTETGEATVTITGKGNYTGTASTTFTIVADKTTLDAAITDAAAYYESITADYADIAATLLEAINAAKGVQADKAATQQAVDNAAEALKKAVQDAKDAVQVITGIDSVKVSAVNSVWYDLNGRKLEGNPTKKGVYIQNGRKVVIK